MAHTSLHKKLDWKKIKILKSDNEGEFTFKEFREFLKLHGIQHQTSVIYTTQQNVEVVKQLNRTIVEIAHCMLHHRNLEPRYYA
jgi:transposase InsO family protein